MTLFAGCIGSNDPEGCRRILSAGIGGAGEIMPSPDGPVVLAACPAADPFRDWPILSREGVAWLFDGRLDNRAELARQLDFDGLGTDAAAAGDHHYLAAAWRRWGVDLGSRLLGDFAFAVWDGPNRRLILGRDPSPTRILYWHRGAQVTAFATGLRPLLALPEVPRVLDEGAVAAQMAIEFNPWGGTVWRDIRLVTGGTTLVIGPDGERSLRWWSPADAPRVRFRREEEYFEAGRALFDQAVACRLPERGPIVVSTSGGLDSSAIAATAARLAPGRVRAVTLAPPEGMPLIYPPGFHGDERPFVAALAAMTPGLALEISSRRGIDPIECDPTPLFRATMAPVIFSGVLGWFLPTYRRAAELACPVLLTGDGGECSITHDGLDLPSHLFLRGRWRRLLAELRGLARESGLSPRRQFRSFVLAALEPPTLRAWRRGPKASHARAPLGQGVALGAFEPRRMVWPSVAEFQSLPVLRSRHATEAIFGRRILSGIQTASPYWDRRVIAFCAGLPRDLFLRDGVPRAFARRLFADRLPKAILDNRRKGHQYPEAFHVITARRAGLAAEIEDLAASPSACRVIDVARLRRMLVEWPVESGPVPWAAARDYVSAFSVALSMGRFLRWVEGGAD
ncbi:MAG: asparagine synthase [Alphaproteobacteria bacterium]|nr:asparagine synthase [Alphaproteobacteria bacterium]